MGRHELLTRGERHIQRSQEALLRRRAKSRIYARKYRERKKQHLNLERDSNVFELHTDEEDVKSNTNDIQHNSTHQSDSDSDYRTERPKLMYGKINLLNFEGSKFTSFARTIARTLFNEEELINNSFRDDLSSHTMGRPPFQTEQDLEKIGLLKEAVQLKFPEIARNWPANWIIIKDSLNSLGRQMKQKPK